MINQKFERRTFPLNRTCLWNFYFMTTSIYIYSRYIWLLKTQFITFSIIFATKNIMSILIFLPVSHEVHSSPKKKANFISIHINSLKLVWLEKQKKINEFLNQNKSCIYRISCLIKLFCMFNWRKICNRKFSKQFSQIYTLTYPDTDHICTKYILLIFSSCFVHL